MKKVLTAFIAAVFIIALTPQINAEVSGDWRYWLNDDGTAVISGYGGNAANVTIPGKIGGKTVTGISYSAFMLNDSFVNVTIPDSVISIGGDAFEYCYKLKSVKIGKGVQKIGENAFGANGELTSINVDKDNAYYTSIDGALFDKSGETLIAVPGGKTSYTIPESTRDIREYAFHSCRKLTSVTIPKGVTRIGNCAFFACDALTEFKADKDSYCFSAKSGVLFNKQKTELICYPPARPNTSYAVPSGVAYIGDYAFEYCKNIKSVTFPKSLKSIGCGAFWNCNGLKTLTFKSKTPPEFVREVFDDRVFISTVYVPKGAKRAYSQTDALKEYKIKEK